MPLTLFSTWPGDPIVVRLLLAGSQFPGFMSYSTSNYRMNFFAVAKSSVSGPLNERRPNLQNTKHQDGRPAAADFSFGCLFSAGNVPTAG